MSNKETADTNERRKSNTLSGYLRDRRDSGPNGAFVTLGVVVLIAAVVALGYHYWKYASTHVGTDDAYLTANIVQIAPQVSGTVTQVYVDDNEPVKRGQLIAVLDDAPYQAAVRQAEANLNAALAAVDSSNINVALTGDTGNAQIKQSEANVAQVEGAVGSSLADVQRIKAQVGQANATAAGVKANINTAEAGVQAAIAMKQRADASMDSASAQVLTAEAGVRSAQASLESAKAICEKAIRDNERYQKLVARSVIGTQMAEQAAVAEQTAKSQLQAALEQVNSSKAALSSKKAELRAAKEQVNAALATVDQQRSLYAASKQQYLAADAGVAQAKAQLQSSVMSVTQSQARHKQSLAQLDQSNTAPKLLKMSMATAHQAQAKVDQLRAALVDAKLKLSYTRILAPVDGRVSKKSINEGVLVQPGTPLMAIIPPPSQNMWVVANLKETQLAHVAVGQHAVITVDSYPGMSFNATVGSISAGTGASFSLLPPDNATGNFTKVVQRVPVKLIMDPGQKDIDRLRNGMSVAVNITLK